MQVGDTPLTWASYNGHHKTVEVLLKHKADVNSKTNVSRCEGCEDAPTGGLEAMDWVSRFGIRVLLWRNEKK